MDKLFVKKKSVFEYLHGYFFMLIGCVCYGMSTSFFLEPSSIVAGGASGLAVTINYWWQSLPVGMLIIAINIPILIFGIRAQGWRFIIKCLVTVVCLGVITDLLTLISFVTETVDDKILCSLYGGILQGIGIGLFVRFEFSSGGTELLGRLITKKARFLKINVCIGVLDAIVVILGTIVTWQVNGVNNMLYALIVIFCSTKVSEIVLVGLEKSKFCFIITEKGSEISELLVKNSPRGVTMITGEGMYTHKNRNVLMTCIRNRQLSQLKALVYSVDPNAFVIVNDANEVRGNGFQSLIEDAPVDEKTEKNKNK